MYEIADAASIVLIVLITGALCFVAAAMFLTIQEAFSVLKRKWHARQTPEGLDSAGPWVDNQDA